MPSPRDHEEKPGAGEPTPSKTTTTTTTTSTSTGRQSAGLQHGQGRSSTPDKRHPGMSTDDAAIFIEDTVDRATAQCIATSPSALAILSPQRMPMSRTHVDVTDYDAEHIGSAAAAAASSVKKGRRSGQLGAGETSLPHGVRLSFGKSPTPKASRKSGSLGAMASQDASFSRSTPGRDDAASSASSSMQRRQGGTPSPAAARPPSHSGARSDEDDDFASPEPMVSLSELERVERERNRFEKMFEHQKALYEDMAAKQAETHSSLQEKIVEVVALSTRNEESKKFIRQLKREMAESRTRVMDIQNRALEEARAERDAKSRYESRIEEQEHKYRRAVERHETKMAGMESLLKDLTCMRSEHDRIHVSQLDALLKAAYAKSTALFSDLLRQTRQIDLLYDAKEALERQVDQLRRDKRDAEATLAEERRRMLHETERYIDQIEEQQQSILNLRQMLIRTLDAANQYEEEDGGGEDEEEVSTDCCRDTDERSVNANEPTEASCASEDADATPLRSRGEHRRVLPKARGRSSGQRALAHPRAQRTSLAQEAEDDEGGAKGKPTASVAVALTSNPVVATPRSRVDAEGSRSLAADGDSIFKPPQRRGSRGRAEADDEEAAFPRKSAVSNASAAAVASSKPPSLRERDAAKASEKAAAESHRAEPHRIPQHSTITAIQEDKENCASRGEHEGGGVGTSAAGAHKRLDFAAALASVSAKREQARRAREGNLKEEKENRIATSSGSSGGVSTKTLSARQPLKPRSTSSPCADDRDEEDNDDVPRLVPKQMQPRLALRNISQKLERLADK